MDTSSELPDVGDILYRLAGWPGQTFWNRMEHERLFGDFGFSPSNDTLSSYRKNSDDSQKDNF